MTSLQSLAALVTGRAYARVRFYEEPISCDEGSPSQWVAEVIDGVRGDVLTDACGKGATKVEALHRLHLALSPLARSQAVARLMAVIDSAEECEAAVAAERGAEMGGTR